MSSEDIAYLVDICKDFRDKRQLLIEKSLVQQIMERFQTYYNLNTAFCGLEDKAITVGALGGTTYSISLIMLYYSLPPFSYCFGESQEHYKVIKLPIEQITASRSVSKGETSKVVLPLNVNFKSLPIEALMDDKVRKYTSLLSEKIYNSTAEQLLRVVYRMRIDRDLLKITLPDKTRPGSGKEISGGSLKLDIREAVGYLATNTSAIFTLFEENFEKQLRNSFANPIHSQFIKTTRLSPDVLFIQKDEIGNRSTVLNIECKRPSIKHVPLELDDNKSMAYSIAKQPTSQALLSCHESPILTDAMDYCFFSFEYTVSDDHRLPFRCLVLNIASIDPTVTLLLDSVVYHRWMDYVHNLEDKSQSRMKQYKSFIRHYTLGIGSQELSQTKGEDSTSDDQGDESDSGENGDDNNDNNDPTGKEAKRGNDDETPDNDRTKVRRLHSGKEYQSFKSNSYKSDVFDTADSSSYSSNNTTLTSSADSSDKKSKYKFFIVQDSLHGFINLVLKLKLNDCIHGFGLNINPSHDKNSVVIVKMLDLIFLKDNVSETLVFYESFKEMKARCYKDIANEIKIYKKILSHNKKYPDKVIHAPRLLGSGDICRWVTEITSNWRMFYGPAMVLEYLKGMRHPKTKEEFERAEIEIERLAEMGYKHRDIRKQNIMYDANIQTAYLIDFQHVTRHKDLDAVAEVNKFRKKYLEILEKGDDFDE